MQLVKQIGRYQQFPILAVFAVQEQKGVKAFFTSLRFFAWSVLTLRAFRGSVRWPAPGYIATLVNGQRCHFTEEEKKLHEAEMLKHHQTMQIMGICKALGHPGMR